MSKTQQLVDIKKILRKNIASDRTAMEYYEKESTQLLDIIERVVKLGESDSVLVIGPANCGKTTLVEHTVDKALETFGNNSFTLVNLNGIVHINDNLALQEIIRALQVENLPEGSMITGSFADNLTFVLNSFKSGNRNTSKPIVFIMDEFEYFCEHKNQTLLYNLFDVAMSAQAPLCVIGVTPRIDITELFEKRVKSRFSQRHINLNLPTDYKFLLKLIESVLTIKNNKKWNSSVTNIMKDNQFIKNIKKISEYDVNLRLINTMLFKLTTLLNDSNNFFEISDFEKVVDSLMLDCKVKLIRDLSVLELCLVITMKHHNEIYDFEPLNFEMVYQRYMKFAVNSSVNITQYPVVFKAFERLKEMELIVPISGPGKRVKKKEYVLYSFILTDQQIKEALNNYDNLPTDLSQWASSSFATV